MIINSGTKETNVNLNTVRKQTDTQVSADRQDNNIKLADFTDTRMNCMWLKCEWEDEIKTTEKHHVCGELLIYWWRLSSLTYIKGGYMLGVCRCVCVRHRPREWLCMMVVLIYIYIYIYVSQWQPNQLIKVRSKWQDTKIIKITTSTTWNPLTTAIMEPDRNLSAVNENEAWQ